MTADTNEVENALRDLKVSAPDGMSESVLTAVGLLDGWTRFESPIGPLFIAHNPEGVSAVAPAEDIAEFAEIHGIRTQRRLGVESALPARVAKALERTVTSGKLERLPVDLRGLTEFQQAVLRKTAEIPPGEIRPYGWVAREIGKPGATRAVGSALNKNPIPVLIPGHRVGRSDGTIGEYAFGPEMKRALLASEGADPDRLDELAARGVRVTGTKTTKIFCLPTCRHARRSMDKHRVEFRSIDAAHDAGYRSCKVCRPAAA